MRAFSLLMALALAGVGIAAEKKAAEQAKEPIYEGKCLSQWVAEAWSGSPRILDCLRFLSQASSE